MLPLSWATLSLKLLVVPSLVGAASLAGRRWGPTVGGWLVALPLTSGPVVFFLAVEQGAQFAARSAQGTLAGVIPLATFCLVYGWLASRAGWLSCSLAGWGAYGAVALLLNQAVVSLAVSFLAVCAFLTLALSSVRGGSPGKATMDPPLWDIPVRMVTTLVMVSTLTWIAPWLGPRLSGLLTPFPVAATVLAAFTHRAEGHGAAGQLLRGLVGGLYTFAVFFLVVAGMLETYGVAPAFGAAMLASVAAHWSSLVLLTQASWGRAVRSHVGSLRPVDKGLGEVNDRP